MLDLETAKTLTPGTILFEYHGRNADSTPRRWKVNGRPQTWKRAANAHRVRVPLKHGMWTYHQLDQDQLETLTTCERCAAGRDGKTAWNDAHTCGREETGSLCTP